MSSNASFDETLVLPRALEALAKESPHITWMSVPNDSKLTEGWRNITYGELGQAVDGFALWAQSIVGASEVVAYMGINDVKYAVAEIGTIKMGRTIFLPSPRNSSEGSVSLFEAASCSVLIHSESMDSQIKALKAVIPTLQTHLIPSFDNLRLQGANAAYRGQYSVQEDASTFILQTSGSTGLPRPIRYTNGAVSTLKFIADLALPPELRTKPGAAQAFGKPMFSMAPFFHFAGTMLIVRSILCKGPAVLPPSDTPPTAELILRVLRQTRPSMVSIFPSVLEDLVNLPGGLEEIAELDMVTFGGAPLSQEIGDKVCGVTFLYSGIGSTEAGGLATELPRDRKDWNYCAWRPASGVEMQPRDDGLHECVIKSVDRRYQMIFHTHPDVTEYRTKDLFEEHETKPGLWRFRGRADDVLVLSNGEKLNPVDFEKRVELHPWVKGAIVVGQNRFQTGLLIEPAWDVIPPENGVSDILEEVWPTIEQADHTMPKYGVVWKSKLAIAAKDRPFVRTAAKRNIVRSKSIDVYATEIEALYTNETFKDINRISPDANLHEMQSYLRNILHTAGLPLPEETLNNQDLFALGLDSLQTLQLTSIINQNPAWMITSAEVYKHPTINSLAVHLMNQDIGSLAIIDREKAMSDMLKRYTHDLRPRPPVRRLETEPRGHSILLTGSTGNLGCLLLQELIQSSSDTHIFCLNRAVDGQARQSQQFLDRGFRADFSKVTFLHSNDPGQTSLGLPSEVYEELLKSVGLIILNAWTVDFNKALQSFERLVAGTRRFVDFGMECHQQAHIVMISSVASVGNWASVCCDNVHDNLEVPERVISDNRVPAPGGYGESKHVASSILAAAAKVGITSTIIRVGQLAGPAEDRGRVEWNRREWFPSLIATSKALGVLPSSLGGMTSIDWVPIDLAAKAIIETAQAIPENSENPRVLHVVNPETTTWTDLLPAVQACLAQELDRDVPIITYAEWLSKIQEIPMTTGNAELVPGLKLLDFYHGLAATQRSLRLATTKTITMSPTLAELCPVDTDLMEKWIRQLQ